MNIHTKQTNENKKREEKKSSKKIIISFSIIGIMLAAFLIFTSAKIEETQESYVVQEVIYEKVPKIIPEEINETKFFEKSAPLQTASCDEPKFYDYRYNFTMESTAIIIDQESKNWTCIANITNLEKVDGNFTMYVLVTRSDNLIYDYFDQTKEIPANSVSKYYWSFEVPMDKTAVCTLKQHKISQIKRCDFAPIDVYKNETYPVTVKKLQNKTILVDEPKTIDVVKYKPHFETRNRVFGYIQPFYLGY